MFHRVLFIIALLGLITRSSAADDFLGRSFDHWSEMLSSSQQNERAYAAWAIGKMAEQSAGKPHDQVYFAELVKLIHDNDATVRYWSVMGLAGYAKSLSNKDGGQTAGVNTVAPLMEDKAAARRIAAAQAIGILGQPEKALPVLVGAMSDPQDSARIQAASALEAMGPAARPAVATLEKGTTDSSEYVKRISERTLQTLDPNRKSSQPAAKGKKNKAKAKKAA
jgi:HEAT repeat protein